MRRSTSAADRAGGRCTSAPLAAVERPGLVEDAPPAPRSCRCRAAARPGPAARRRRGACRWRARTWRGGWRPGPSGRRCSRGGRAGCPARRPSAARTGPRPPAGRRPDASAASSPPPRDGRRGLRRAGRGWTSTSVLLAAAAAAPSAARPRGRAAARRWRSSTASGQGSGLHRVGELVGRDHLQAHVARGAQRQDQRRPLQAERGEPAQGLEPAQPRQRHGDDRAAAAPAGQRLEGGAAVVGELDPVLARQRLADRPQPVRAAGRRAARPRRPGGGSAAGWSGHGWCGSVGWRPGWPSGQPSAPG